jgi:hypothetical protein
MLSITIKIFASQHNIILIILIPRMLRVMFNAVMLSIVALFENIPPILNQFGPML